MSYRLQEPGVLTVGAPADDEDILRFLTLERLNAFLHMNLG